MSERFYVRESSGIAIRLRGQRGGYSRLTLVHIFDRAYCHREVARFGCSQEAWTYCHQDLNQARRRAALRCAELNAWAEVA